jgi:TetR/AcrR family transcriptional regulator, regulator of cefoperazone and chloramphenicol sensitivity
MSRTIKQRGTAQAATREALLEAAAEIFARRGFAATTVREICDQAGANIAAINYHFGDKAGLYAEVLTHALKCARQKYPPHLGTTEKSSAETRLRAFIESFLLRLFDDGRHAWHGKLMSREMVEPTAALDRLVEDEIRPMAQILHGIVRELLGRKATDETVRLCSLSIVSQCLFYHQCRPVLQRLFPAVKIDPGAAAPLAEHITNFSLGAIQQAPPPARKGRR